MVHRNNLEKIFEDKSWLIQKNITFREIHSKFYRNNTKKNLESKRIYNKI